MLFSLAVCWFIVAMTLTMASIGKYLFCLASHEALSSGQCGSVASVCVAVSLFVASAEDNPMRWHSGQFLWS